MSAHGARSETNARPHLCQVSPGRGAAARPAAAGTRSSLHDSCTTPRRSRTRPTRPLHKSRRMHKSSRVGKFRGTLPHFTPGIPSRTDSLLCCLTANRVAVLSRDGTRAQWSDGGFTHLTERVRLVLTLLVGTSVSGSQLAGGVGVFSWTAASPSRALHFAVVDCARACFHSRAHTPLPVGLLLPSAPTPTQCNIPLGACSFAVCSNPCN